VLKICMGYLGLSGDRIKEDNLFQRLFWPSDHLGEVDSLGQQGFWVCILVATMSFIFVTVQGHWLIALLAFVFFVLGGIGIREHSTPTALIIAIAYVTDQMASFLVGRFPGFLSLIAMVLLIANIRGTWIAARWVKQGDPDLLPERMNETWRDRLVDQMPQKVWPKTKAIFYCISFVYLTLLALGIISIAHHWNKPLVRPQGQTLTVNPPN
jgi:hypothetical protein